MTIKEITISKAQKRGLANYGSVLVSASVTVSIEPGEKPNVKPVWEAINGQIADQLAKYD